MNHVSQPTALLLKVVCIALLLLLSGHAWAGDFPFLGVHPSGESGVSKSASAVLEEAYLDSLNRGGYAARDSLIRRWAADGSICRAIGHRWELGWLWGDDFMPVSTTVWLGNVKTVPTHKRCSICGKIETKTEEWR